MLNPDAASEFQSWIRTLSPPQSMRNDSESMKRELNLLRSTLHRAGVTTSDQVSSVFEEIKRTAQTRSWPTSKELIEACSKVRGKVQQQFGKGDRSKLTFDELEKLENEILPKARSWLEYPSLREHGEATLEFWGEAIPAAA